MRLDLLAAVNRARFEPTRDGVVTDLQSGEATLHSERERGEGELAQHLARAFLTGQSGSVDADGRRLFVNVRCQPPSSS